MAQAEQAVTKASEQKIEVGPGDTSHLENVWNFDQMGDQSGKRDVVAMESVNHHTEKSQHGTSSNKKALLKASEQVVESDALSTELLKDDSVTKPEVKLRKKKSELREEGGENEENEERKGEEVSEEKEVSKDDLRQSLDSRLDASKKSKPVILRVGDEAFEVDPGAFVPVRVDGKEVAVSLQDLRDNFSGKVSWDRKFQDLSKERKGFEGDRGQVDDLITNFRVLAEEKDYLGAISLLAEASGLDGVNFVKSFNKSILDQVDSFSKMTHEQRQIQAMQSENEFLSRHNKTKEDRRNHKDQEKAMVERVDKTIENTGATREELYSIMQEATANGVDNVTPEELGSVYQSRKHRLNLGMLVVDARPGVSDIDLRQTVETLVQVQKSNPDFTSEDLKEIIEEVFERHEPEDAKADARVAKAKKLTKRVAEERPELLNKHKAQPRQELTFEDVEIV